MAEYYVYEITVEVDRFNYELSKISRSQLEINRAIMGLMRIGKPFTVIVSAIGELFGLPPKLDLSKTFKDKVVPAIEKQVNERFETDGFGSWEPLSSGYLQEKIRSGYPPDILVRSGHMKRSVTQKGAPDNICLITSNRMTWGSRDPLVALHSKGVKGKLPAREVLGLRDTDEEMITKIIEDEVDRIFEE